jgi:hypothetical protein
VATLAAAGTTAYAANNASIDSADAQANQKALLKQQEQAQANQANLTKQEAVLGAQGQTQQQTGGSLTDPGTAALNDLLAGYPGYQGGSTTPSTSTGTGIGSSGVANATATPTSTGTPDIASILAALRGGGNGIGGGLGLGSSSSPASISGGNSQTQPAQPQTYFELANPQV